MDYLFARAFRKVITTECVICRLCLSMKPLQHKIPSYLVRRYSLDVQLWDAVVTLQLECLRCDVGWSFPGGLLSICYNRTGAFQVAGIYLIQYDRGFVILLVNLLVRLTVFRCFSVFHLLWLVLFHTVDVSVFSWVLMLFATVFVHRAVTSVRPLV